MFDCDVDFSSNKDVGVFAIAVCEEVQSEDHGAVGGILKGYYAC